MNSEVAQFKTPIVLIIFNRPQHTERVFRRIAEMRPTRLLIIADGPRASRPGEAILCESAREVVRQISWPCEVSTNFSEYNLGCRDRVISGLNWAFSEVEEAVVLEDDIFPDPSFFRFCEEMLDRFRSDARVSMVTGFNIVQDRSPKDTSYFFSHLTHIWGWATWQRSWARYDEQLKDWPKIKASGEMGNLFEDPKQYRFWERIFDQMHAGTGPNTWDYQWVYTNFINNALSIVPKVNLIENIGFGPEATHTKQVAHAPTVSTTSLQFPLLHPPAIIPLRDLDKLDGERSKFRLPTLVQRVWGKIRRTLRTPEAR
ncbi:MAG TPA: hypothetical protein VGN16_08385 [Acidobacteriaceae bacterium]|jgi:hypothetical protein